MKRILALLLLVPAIAFGAANDLLMSQRNSTDTGSLSRTIAVPLAADGIVGYTFMPTIPDTRGPVVLTLGTGLQLSGTVLSATAAAQQQVDWNATTGITSIANKPTLAPVATAGTYASLTGIPSTFPPAAHTQAFSTITSTPTNCAGYGILDCVTPTSLASALTSYATTSALTAGLAGKFNTPAGSIAQYLRGDGSLATFPTAVSAFTNDSAFVNQSGARSAISLTTTGTSGAATYNSATGVLNVPAYANSGGTVTSVTAGTGLSGGVITTSGTISMPNTGTAGTYQSVTTDAQGRVTSGLALSINDAPGRALVTTTTSTGFQISATRVAEVCYEGSFATTSTIGGPSSASVFLETADTNSTTATDWTIKATQAYSNNITLAVVLNQVQGNNWSFCRYIPAGKFVRIRAGTPTGTASASINANQQETLH